MEYHIGWDKDLSTEFDPVYIVYTVPKRNVVYVGSYPQCLVICGAFSLEPGITLKEINDKCNGYLTGKYFPIEAQ